MSKPRIVNTRIAKKRVYVDHPSEAPEWARVQEGERGGFYYFTSNETEPEETEPAEGGSDSGPGPYAEGGMHSHTYHEYEQALDEGEIPVFVPPGYKKVGNVHTPDAYSVGEHVMVAEGNGRVNERGTITDIDGHNVYIETPTGEEVIADTTDIEYKWTEESDPPTGADFETRDELFSSGYFSFTNGSTNQNGVQQAVWKEWMRSKHGEDHFKREYNAEGDGWTWTEAMVQWRVGGYWMGDCRPIWEAAQEMSDGDPEIPDDLMGRSHEMIEGTDEVLKESIQSSQEYVRRFVTGEEGTVRVKRGISRELAEKAKQAKANGEPLEINPRAMESWTLDEKTSEEYGDVILHRDLSPEDVAYYGPLMMPPLSGVEELTALGNGPYEIPPEDIEVIEDDG